jgi:hypothetical protein
VYSPTAAGSAGTRSFLAANYTDLHTLNPGFALLDRPFPEVKREDAAVHARYGVFSLFLFLFLSASLCLLCLFVSFVLSFICSSGARFPLFPRFFFSSRLKAETRGCVPFLFARRRAAEASVWASVLPFLFFCIPPPFFLPVPTALPISRGRICSFCPTLFFCPSLETADTKTHLFRLRRDGCAPGRRSLRDSG